MKVSYSFAAGRASCHCITWIYRKKRHRRYFRTRLDAVRFRNEKEQELGIRQTTEIENEIIFLALGEIKDRLDSINDRIDSIEGSIRTQESYLESLRKPPVPKILRISEADDGNRPQAQQMLNAARRSRATVLITVSPENAQIVVDGKEMPGAGPMDNGGP